MTIRSERLVMRPVSEADAESLLMVFRDPEVRRYLLDDSLVSLDWVRNEIASSDERFATVGAGLWAMRLVDTSAVIGFVGFRDFLDPSRLQLLYGLLPEYWGRGFATEAAKRICDHAFRDLGFHRIEAAMDSPNERSIKLAARLGLSRSTSVDQPDGTVLYEMDRDGWRRA